MNTIANRINTYNSKLTFNGTLPDNINIMNPYRDNKDILPLSAQFYNRYYNDNSPRKLILGINPGRLGAGVTGIPFTDSKRLQDKCGIPFNGKLYHEPSSEFIYDMIDAYGGPDAFYSIFYINSVCPLGFTAVSKKGQVINYNYYDSDNLYKSVKEFIIKHLQLFIIDGFATDVCYCLGTGKNYKHLKMLNNEFKIFDNIIPLEHPRYVMQYKSKNKQYYINKYLENLNMQ